MLKCAVFSCQGLGDGLISLVLSQNLHQNHFAPTTFHPSLSALQAWFPHLPIRPFPPLEELERYDLFFLFYENSPRMRAVLDACRERHWGATRVLNPIATTRTDYPYWEGGRFDGRRTFVENLYRLCRDHFKFPHVTMQNGVAPPAHLVRGRYPNRVVLHPVSAKESKNWPKEKYLALAERLREEGYDPAFVVGPQEGEAWKGAYALGLAELAACVYESGAMIGNDSGVGHLASCLGVPTLTICMSRSRSRFWRPGWGLGVVVTPSPCIPNVKGCRWRDLYWKRWITVRRVLRAFRALRGAPSGSH
jgi:hypothetical protein